MATFVGSNPRLSRGQRSGSLRLSRGQLSGSGCRGSHVDGLGRKEVEMAWWPRWLGRLGQRTWGQHRDVEVGQRMWTLSTVVRLGQRTRTAWCQRTMTWDVDGLGVEEDADVDGLVVWAEDVDGLVEWQREDEITNDAEGLVADDMMRVQIPAC
ncbi:hypothetical protein THAOC_34325 [Thalassiosira oceanica]|uniref:Uncharacterized protein n=1 Tax=Thalassiosira oceanica TaxID=159749 RepID=K0R569_THAOC|nr:hypothetical protein THAOC_34325 [Thalassiosira oceanica]|eukprot:EJK46984.1 hypothetical protein THAOC_34325 [Thalassiosira oceanica]